MTRATRLLTIDPARPDADALDEAADLIRKGGLVVFPTETVYGLGADATNPAAVLRIFEAKGRPATNPLIVHGGNVAEVRRAAASWPDSATKLAERFWPGPLSLVLRRSDLIPDEVTCGLETVGLRVPDHPVATAFLQRTGRPVAAPSANRSTGVSPTTAGHVLKDLDGRVDLILDAGPTPLGIESTVLDLTLDPPRLLRPGAITQRQIESLLSVKMDRSSITLQEDTPHKSPGQSEVHYSPRASTRVIDLEQAIHFSWPNSRRYALLVAGTDLPSGLGHPTFRRDWADPGTAARELYATLHHCDDEGVEIIYVVLPPHEDPWRAVYDRLWRASRRWAREDTPLD
ncbi:MAG: L-threonylcarbamoyladenylate synthase [Isosphaeraceae bacterium]